MKNLWKEYLYFSRKERIALIVLAFVISLLIFLPQLITTTPVLPPNQLATFDTIVPQQAIHAATQATPATASAFFPFDPNTISKQGLLQLGLKEKTANTLINYRNKGGKFYRPEDLRKIYGLSATTADRLIPYITIKQIHTQQQHSTETPHSSANETPTGSKRLAITDINKATADDWQRFPGIGEVLSRRIVAFRYKLGGFQSVQQIRQTYGLPDSVFENILPFLRIDTTSLPHQNNH